MKSKNWINRNFNDLYIKEAKKKGYLSRSSFKLIEIEKRYNLIVKSNNVLELGSSPGGWSQVLFEFNPNIKLFAFDLLNMKYSNKNLIFINEDFLNYDFGKFKKKFDLIVSDIAPNTSGHKSTDHLKISSIIFDIISLLDKIANKNSNLVFKIWKGSEEKEIIHSLKKIYELVSYFKPKSSRNESSEIYIICENLK
tara:strand:- start:236 stop:823 length:588 start_codon:yes stop_codon:yes gene_type:complete